MKTRLTNRARLGALIVTTLAVVALSACSNSDNASADHNPQDISFAQNMIPHHGQAVEMAKLAVSRASNERVKSLAKQIQGAQQPEINLLNGWLTSWGEKSVDPTATGGEHATHESSMPGMMASDNMQMLESASGAAFDRMFLEMMTEHHRGAIEMAKTESSAGKNAEAKVLATSISTSQQSEVTEMQQLLAQLK